MNMSIDTAHDRREWYDTKKRSRDASTSGSVISAQVRSPDMTMVDHESPAMPVHPQQGGRMIPCSYCQPALAPTKGAPTMCSTCLANELLGRDARTVDPPSLFSRAISRLRRVA